MEKFPDGTVVLDQQDEINTAQAAVMDRFTNDIGDFDTIGMLNLIKVFHSVDSTQVTFNRDEAATMIDALVWVTDHADHFQKKAATEARAQAKEEWRKSWAHTPASFTQSSSGPPLKKITEAVARSEARVFKKMNAIRVLIDNILESQTTPRQ